MFDASSTCLSEKIVYEFHGKQTSSASYRQEAIRELLTKVLNENGYTTDSCGTRLEAMGKAGEKFYNIALIDIFLPGMNEVPGEAQGKRA